jgi:hypothetical protein
MLEYYRLWLRTAIRRNLLEFTDLWSGLVAAAIGIVCHFFPQTEAVAQNLSWQIPVWAFGLIVVMRIFVAPYEIWKNQKGDLKILQEKILSDKPNISMSVEQTITGSFPDGAISCFLNMTLRNTGMPSSIEKWRASVFHKGQIQICKLNGAQEDVVLTFSDAPNLIIKPKDFIYDKCVPPLLTGSIVRGWVWLRIEGLETAKFESADCLTIIECENVHGDKLSCTYKANDKSGSLKYYPDGTGGLRS